MTAGPVASALAAAGLTGLLQRLLARLGETVVRLRRLRRRERALPGARVRVRGRLPPPRA